MGRLMFMTASAMSIEIKSLEPFSVAVLSVSRGTIKPSTIPIKQHSKYLYAAEKRKMSIPSRLSA